MYNQGTTAMKALDKERPLAAERRGEQRAFKSVVGRP